MATTRVATLGTHRVPTHTNALSLINDFVIPLSVAFRPRAPRPTEPPRTGAASAAGPELELVPGWVKGIDALESLSCFLPLQCTRSMFPSKERVIARNYYNKGLSHRNRPAAGSQSISKFLREIGPTVSQFLNVQGKFSDHRCQYWLPELCSIKRY